MNFFFHFPHASSTNLNLRNLENLPNTGDDFENRTSSSFLLECAGRISASGEVKVLFLSYFVQLKLNN